MLVHFHSFSCVATFTSSMTRGTQPPNTYILEGGGHTHDAGVKGGLGDHPWHPWGGWGTLSLIKTLKTLK